MGSRPERVSVVIPAWGSYAELVPRAAASVLESPGVPARVLVVDNACSVPIFPVPGRDVIRSEARLSRGAARNLGLSHVETEYVVFLDADDVLLPGALDRLIGALDRADGSPACVGGIVDPSGAPYRASRPIIAALARRPQAFAWANAAWSVMPTQGCTIMHTGAVRDAGGYGDASHGEDWMLGACLAFRGQICFDPVPALVYHSRSDSPGSARASRRTLLERAARVRARLREDPVAPGEGLPIALLALAQAAAALVVHPLVTALRFRRGAGGVLSPWHRGHGPFGPCNSRPGTDET